MSNRTIGQYVAPNSLARIAGLALVFTGLWLVYESKDYMQGAQPIGLGFGILGIRAKQDRD